MPNSSENYSRLHIFRVVRYAIDRFNSDSLFRNSMYLMLSTAVMAGFGFIFWIIAAHAYSTEQIGFATALISATILLSNFSMLGFDSVLVRYLPKSKKQSAITNTALLSVGAATAIASLIYLLGIHQFSPKFSQLSSNLTYAILFIVFVIMVSLNTLTDSFFVGNRASKYNLITYTVFGIVKVTLPLVLVAFGQYGIFFAYTGSVIVSLGLSFYFMKRYFNYSISVSPDKKLVRSLGRFSLYNYLSGFMLGAPNLLLPTIVLTRLGASQSGFFYMASTIAALLYIIPQATSRSLFAEGAHKSEGLKVLVISSLKLMGAILIPAAVFVLVLGKYLLKVFGDAYAMQSFPVLRIMVLISIVMIVTQTGITILKVTHAMKKLMIISTLYMVVTLFLIYVLSSNGIMGSAYALLFGQLFMAGIFLGIYLNDKIPRSNS